MRKSLALFMSVILLFVSSFLNVGNGHTEAANISFESLGDPELHAFIEESVYSGVIAALDSDAYFVECVKVKYVSKEFIEEIAYNSQANIFFGYTLEELDDVFQGTPYVFTLGEDGQTTVTEFEEYDDTYERVIKNIMVGSGVILVCVTVSVVSWGVGAPAVSMIFAVSAKTGTIVALSDGVISGVVACVVTGWQTGDFDEALKAAALSGSEGFKWGAITGAVIGGATEYNGLRHTAAYTHMSMDDVAFIQWDSKLPLAYINSFHSVDEYKVYKAAGLKSTMVNGKWAYTQDIDWDFMDNNGYTNAERVEILGLAPVDNNGIAYELHHIGQNPDSPIAILTWDQHRGIGNNRILHPKTVSDVDHGPEWNKTVKQFWKSFLQMTR